MFRVQIKVSVWQCHPCIGRHTVRARKRVRALESPSWNKASLVRVCFSNESCREENFESHFGQQEHTSPGAWQKWWSQKDQRVNLLADQWGFVSHALFCQLVRQIECKEWTVRGAHFKLTSKTLWQCDKVSTPSSDSVRLRTGVQNVQVAIPTPKPGDTGEDNFDWNKWATGQCGHRGIFPSSSSHSRKLLSR